MIVQFSTGGRGREPAARASALQLRPDMGSLSTGSVNFPTIVYENPTSLVEEIARKMVGLDIRPEIEIFDLSHLHAAARLVEKGLVPPDCHVQFVMGVQNALPALERLLDILLVSCGPCCRVRPGQLPASAGTRRPSWVGRSLGGRMQ